MTIDAYIEQSNRVIEYAESIIETQPDKAKELLTIQLSQTKKLIRKALDNAGTNTPRIE